MDVHQLSSQILQTHIESQADEDWIAEDSGTVAVTSEANPTQSPPPLSLMPNATLLTLTQRTFMNPMPGWMVTPSGAFNGFRGLASHGHCEPSLQPSFQTGKLTFCSPKGRRIQQQIRWRSKLTGRPCPKQSWQTVFRTIEHLALGLKPYPSYHIPSLIPSRLAYRRLRGLRWRRSCRLRIQLSSLDCLTLDRSATRLRFSTPWFLPRQVRERYIPLHLTLGHRLPKSRNHAFQPL